MTQGLPASSDDFTTSDATTGIMATLIADMIRILVPAFSAMRRRVESDLLPSVDTNFTSDVKGVPHHFTLEVDDIRDGEVKCLISIFCGNFNVAKEDQHELATALTAEFGVPVRITMNQSRFEFTVPLSAIF